MKLSKLFALIICCFTLAVPELFAQVGNNNPTGPSGEFNGSVTTGGSYDPYTANATRALTDIVVAGAVGKYGLTYSRVWNTRTPLWQFSQNWGIEVDEVPGQYETYYVTYPDGRQATFTHSANDVDFRATPGIRERMQRWTATNGDSGVCYLKLPDGGKIEFSGTRTWHYDPELIPSVWYEWSLTAAALIDPYGQRTTYTTNADNSFQITEPAGRWIKVYYIASGDPAGGRVDYILASDGRVVDYTWQTQYFGAPSLPYVVLTSVSYYGDPSLTATYTYRMGNIAKQGYALETCDDPLFPGPMKKIKYVYQNTNNPDGSARVFGQIKSETNATTGDVVSTLTVTGPDTRVETRGDGRQRTFTYAGGYLTSWTDFKNIPSDYTYDSNLYVDSMKDGRGNITNFTNNPVTGLVTQSQYPATPNDTTPPTNARGTVTSTYGWPGCPDPNNRDANNPYYPYSQTDEAGNETRFTRDTSKRVTRIDYPDGGYETFSYNPFGQVLSHQMKTGGVETFSYDTRGLPQTYRSPDNATGNPTARYGYDGQDRLSAVTDVFGFYPGDPYHTTAYQRNTRNQLTVTTLPTNPVTGLRHTIINAYAPNGDGTLLSVTDQLGHTTSYTYDDYRRLRTRTTPLRAPGDSTARTTYFSYHRFQLNGDDYTHTNSNVTVLTLPSTNIVKTIYDENYRRLVVTASAANGTTDAATTSYGYDNAGNLTSVIAPDQQPGQANHGKSTTAVYDERNRLWSETDAMNHAPTVITYDAGGRKKTVTQSNGQVVTYDLYDSVNRVLQQTATQTPEPPAVTKYTYDAQGLHMTMQDPRLVQIGSNYVYDFEYDQMGRAKSVTYPPDSAGANRIELYSYDISGRLGTYTNRDGKIQTFSYDNLHRKTGFTWSAGSAPNVSFGYDAADRVTSISNANAIIGRTYYDDNLRKTETQMPTGGTGNTVTYAWNADALRESVLYPSGKKYRYNYTGRDQLKHVQDNNTFLYQAEYVYDVNGNLATRKVGVDVGAFGVVTDASTRDALGRCTRLTHQFTGTTRTFDYVYDVMGNRSSIQRDGGTAEVYGNDLAQQATVGVDSGNTHTYGYDANGNRTHKNGAGTYVTNFLNQPTTFEGQAVSYNINGDAVTYGSDTTYAYDAQNRLTSVTAGVNTSTYVYDGLNRKISQTVNGVTTYNVWDGWSLIEERGAGNALLNSYVYGAGEIIERITGTTAQFYYQDGLGSTSHLSDSAGGLLESYRYGTFGQTTVYDPNTGYVRRNGSIHDVRHLYTGQLWMPATGLYDYRNRVFSPTLTRFLQPDPIGFVGDPSNLYRYCGNNPVNFTDPSGLLITLRGQFSVAIKPNNATNFFRNIASNAAHGTAFFIGALDWGSFGEIMHYMGGGDHGTPGHFAGRGEPFGFGGDLSLGPPLPPSPAPIPSPNDPYYPYIPINPHNLEPLLFPPSVNPRALIAAAQRDGRSWNPFAKASRVWGLRSRGPLDRQLKRTNPLYQNAGNWLLGAQGRAMGFPTDTLLRAGGFFNHRVGPGDYGDDIEDSFMIKLGAEYYDGL
jgi:RHS repeat-associated protein